MWNRRRGTCSDMTALILAHCPQSASLRHPATTHAYGSFCRPFEASSLWRSFPSLRCLAGTALGPSILRVLVSVYHSFWFSFSYSELKHQSPTRRWSQDAHWPADCLLSGVLRIRLSYTLGNAELPINSGLFFFVLR